MELIKFFKYYYGLFQLYQYYLFLKRPYKQIEFEITPKIAKAFWSAVMLHHKVRQKYGDLPYGFHLKDVFQKCFLFMYQIPFSYTERELVLTAALYHDSIEDARLTYANLVAYYGLEVANIVYCCTNEKGKTRKDRANDKFYNELVENYLAVYVKLCDRMANVESSKVNKPSMYTKYIKEMPEFINHLSKNGLDERYKLMFEHLKNC